jgi:hemolysin D
MMHHRIQAYRDLASRYWAVFSHFWTRRDDMKSDFYRRTEAEFLPAALSIQETPLSPTVRFTGYLLAALVASALLWSIVGRIDIVVTATGKILPGGRLKSIASVETASVLKLDVAEGDHVRAGQALIELDRREHDADRDKAIDGRDSALFQVARARALIHAIETGVRPKMQALSNLQEENHIVLSEGKWLAEQTHVESQFDDFRAKLGRIDADIERWQKALPLEEKTASDYRELWKNHDVSQHALIEKERALLDLQGELSDAKHQHDALVAETKRVAYDEMAEGQKLAEGFRQDAIRTEVQGHLLTLAAPVDGTVQQLTVHTVGGVVAPAQALMEIVPDDNTIEIQAFLSSKDIGFVREGQTAQVKIDAFDYVKYGTIQGKILQISKDAIQDEKMGLVYSTRVLLSQSEILAEGRPVRLSPGLSATIEIKTGDRRVIDYFLSPLQEHRHDALRER